MWDHEMHDMEKKRTFFILVRNSKVMISYALLMEQTADG